ncbi:PTS sugar transporter subunit IIB [Enorma phocaeensis]|uniref:PTS sugar transporter subunit IIB n=1 Tax=Enorma phocaeensis TaxID=1871019 RepID=UPI001956E21B|nr:PTS sugar transporter subunit IIB [Enorma phocaeensis]MBM6953255.1 PTS sugar transporter subunit IIB [Enorma phocaeensis]
MKKIVLACGSGIATSTAVAQKVTDLLNKNGYEGQFNIVQCAIAEAKSQCEGADLLVATTVAPEGISCPYVSGVPFLTGVGRPAAEQQILDIMAQ